MARNLHDDERTWRKKFMIDMLYLVVLVLVLYVLAVMAFTF